MLWATARSVREERSKQRFALQDFSLIRVSLVRGKSGWRIGSVESEKNYFADCKDQPNRAAVTVVVKLLRQFLHGEVAQSELFDDVKRALAEAGAADAPNDRRIVDIFSLRFFHQLGYVAALPAFRHYLDEITWWQMPDLPKEALRATAKAKEISHL